MGRKYFVILVRVCKQADWEVYCGERGGLAPSLFLRLKDAELDRRRIIENYGRGCTCVRQLHEG